MCGIIGAFNLKEPLKKVKKGLKEIENRGRDGKGFYSEEGLAIGHCLHSVVGDTKQPIESKGVLAANCEIYNWKELNRKYSLDVSGDSEALSRLIEKKDIKEVLDELDGVYSFSYLKDRKIILARDIIGVKPLFFSHSEGFAFASEKKALEKLGFINIIELNPRKILLYDIDKDRISFIERDFFSILPEIKKDKKRIVEDVIRLVDKAIEKRIPERKFGVLFSGGVDSTLIAMILKEKGLDPICYAAALDSETMNEAEDIVYSRKAADSLGLRLKIVRIKEKDVEKNLKNIVPLIEDSNVVKVGVALPFFAACEQAGKDGCKVIFSGLGSEEIFAGYERHKKSRNINEECVSGLLKMYERDMYRDDVITMNNNIELRLPFLDKDLVSYSLRIPGRYKLVKDVTKKILRDAALSLGMDKEFAMRKKRAAQYGSNFHKAIKKFTKKNNLKFMSEYLRQFYPRHNVKLGALVSSGKDSIYAMYVMMQQNYSIGCMISMFSENPDSYMFHTPAIDLVKLQADSIGLPLVEQETRGDKEEELKDLEKALKKAKEDYRIEGIVTGALFSNYQRKRIEKAADSLGLKIFAPLWHINQETEMKEIIDKGFEFMMVKVMAEGLDRGWLGRKITGRDVDKLVELDRKLGGFNIAGEGGEFESLMIDGPIFDKRIKIEDKEIKQESIVSELLIKKARLV